MAQSSSPTEFYLRIREKFPEEAEVIREDKCGLGILHVEVATFSRLTEEALEAGKLWRAKCHLRLVEELLDGATLDLKNALAVSYLENVFYAPRSPVKSGLLEKHLGNRSRKLLDELIAHMNSIHTDD